MFQETPAFVDWIIFSFLILYSYFAFCYFLVFMGLYFLIPDAHSWYFMPLVAPKFFKFLCVFGVHDLILIFFSPSPLYRVR